jgi:hypothetical protein
LLGLDPDTREVTLLAKLEPDARDVVVVPESSAPWNETVYVTRFRSAEILTLDESLSIKYREAPLPSQSFDPSALPADFRGRQAEDAGRIDMDSSVAWRAARTTDGFVLLHQRGRRQSLALGEPVRSAPTGAYGTDLADDPCSKVVGPAVTFVGHDGRRTFSRQLQGHLFVDVAASDGWIALAEAGALDIGAPTSRPLSPTTRTSERAAGLTLPRSGENVPVVSLFRRFSLDFSDASPLGCEPSGAIVTVPEYNQAVAVAFNPTRPSELVALLRDPAQLLLVDLEAATQTTVELSSWRTGDTGHDLFHRSTPSGIACANCHPEGGDDGRVWVFDGVDERRTQSLEVGLRGTAPFHWRGDLEGFSAVVDDVFVSRMGGAPQSEERLLALESWLYQLERPAPLRDPSDSLALEGQALFESPLVGCSGCHSGPALTNNQSYDVGTGEVLQVPSLIGVAYRSPLMHDGCAADLWARFEPNCGGRSHGTTSELTLDQLSALIAYMEAL